MAEKKIIKNQKRNFVDDWLKDLDFIGWLVKVMKDKTKARCLVCHKTIGLSTRGRSVPTNHAEGNKYTEVIDRRKNFFKPKSSTSTTADTSEAFHIHNGWHFQIVQISCNHRSNVQKRWSVYIGQYSFSNKLDQLGDYMDFEICYERCVSSI